MSTFGQRLTEYNPNDPLNPAGAQNIYKALSANQGLSLINNTTSLWNGSAQALPQEENKENLQDAAAEEEEGEYEVEQILEKRVKQGTVFYRVKWKGFSLEDATWEPRDNLSNAPLIIQEFEERLTAAKKAASTKKKPTKNELQSPSQSLISPSEPDSVLGKRSRDNYETESPKPNDKENKKKNKKQPEKKMTSTNENQSLKANPQANKLTVNDEALKPDKWKLPADEDKLKAPEVAAPLATFQKSPSAMEVIQDQSNVQTTRTHFDETKVYQGGSTENPNYMHNLMEMVNQKNLIPPQISPAVQGGQLFHQLFNSQNYLKDNRMETSQTYSEYPSTLSKALQDTIQNPTLMNAKSMSIPNEGANKVSDKLSMSQIMEDDKFMEDPGSAEQKSQQKDIKNLISTLSNATEQPRTKIKKKDRGEYGSLDKGDVPLKVIGIRPVKEENDLEIMISWKARENGTKPYNSKVMRLELLKRGHWMPLLEFYESKMRLESAPEFNPTLLPKY